MAQLLFHLLKSPYDELRNTQAARKTEIGKLDSLVLQQSQSIDQLKKWNKMAMRTFAGIRNDWQKKITQTGDNK